MRGTPLSQTSFEPSPAVRLNRRVVLQASAALATFALSSTANVRGTGAQSASTTRAIDWYEADHADAIGEEITVDAGFAFTAVGAHWDGDADPAPVIELRVSSDAETYSDPFYLSAGVDEGRPTRDARHFSALIFANGAQTIRYRTIDDNGSSLAVPGLGFTFIDGSATTAQSSVGGAFDLQLEPSSRTQPPAIVSRAEWGADESLRTGNDGEIWPPTYSTVEHVIIHHTATAGDGDPAAEIRSIYYYHAITKGWGDIAYNYLVDRYGTIYEGRAGGQDVVGGHSYQYQDGSSGIALLGNYQFDEVSEAGQAAIVAIVAWVGRELDPYGSSDFWAREDLPTICGHRDVDPSTECPGDFFYDDLAAIRNYVAAAMDIATDTPPAGLVIGDTVQVVTDDGGPLRVRAEPGLDAEVLAELPDGVQAVVTDGPTVADGYAWYALDAGREVGWAVADYLVRVAPTGNAVGRFAVGDTVAVAIDGGNLRNGPGLDFSIDSELPYGTRGLVIVGPHVVDDQIWYQLDTPIDIGWMADSILAAADEIAPPAGSPTIGDPVVVATDYLRLRGGPGTSYSVITTLIERTPGTVIDGPRAADGHAWYKLETDLGTGWGAAEFIALDDGATDALGVGPAVVATDALNIRTKPSLDANVVDVLFERGTLDIIDGPTSADGLTWWNVSISNGESGWCVGSYLQMA